MSFVRARPSSDAPRERGGASTGPAPSVSLRTIQSAMPAKYDFVTNSRRSTVYSLDGIVASSQPLASAVGHQILELGGNAADAAIAMAATLNVTEVSNQPLLHTIVRGIGTGARFSVPAYPLPGPHLAPARQQNDP